MPVCGWTAEGGDVKGLNIANGDRAVFCDCCGREIVAIIRRGTILIVKRIHGREHSATVPMAVAGEILATPPMRVAHG